MGYKRPLLQPVYTGDLEGLEIKAKRLTMDQMFIMVGLGDLDMDDKAKTLGLISEACQVLADAIVEWNYEDDAGQPVEPTKDNLAALDFDFLVDVAVGLRRTVTEPDAETGKDFGSSVTSLEASLPMVPLSEPQAS
jgi:hypothetical protein